MTRSVMLDVVEGVATVTLSRPEAGNAIDLATAAELRSVVESLTSLDLGVVVLTGIGTKFCLGGDVRAMAAADDRGQYVAELADNVHAALSDLRRLPVPIVAAVNGTAAGAGLGLVLAADIAIAARTARFLCAYGGVGLSPDCGVSGLLPDVVGPRRAAMLALTERTLPADDAMVWGIVTDVCDSDALSERVDELAIRLARGPRPATGETARLLRESRTTEYGAQLADESATIARSARSPHASHLIERFAAATAV
jgi:2-(1,2-epoxy-1,2-dihydrophenyl)acetyl-CoA isomerase